MSLPQIQHPTKTVKLPLSKLEVKYRPFLVKEEKILVMLRETTDATAADYVQTIGDTIRSCCFDKIDPMTLPSSDLEYLFLRIRSLSKGNISRIAYKCIKPTGEDAPDGTPLLCDHTTEIEVDLDEVEPTMHEGHLNAIPVPGTDFVLHLNYPTMGTLKKIAEKTGMAKVNKLDLVEITLIDCLKMVTQGETVFTVDNEDEVRAFMEQLSDKFFDEMDDKFMNRMPSIEAEVDFKCEKCGHGEKVRLKGLKDFF